MAILRSVDRARKRCRRLVHVDADRKVLVSIGLNSNAFDSFPRFGTDEFMIKIVALRVSVSISQTYPDPTRQTI